MLPRYTPKTCSLGNPIFCAHMLVVDQFGPGCLRADTSNMIQPDGSYILYTGYEGVTTPYSPCPCLEYCGTIAGCVSVEIVVTYSYDNSGDLTVYCNL